MSETETISKINARVVEKMHRTLRISKKKIIKTLENEDFVEKPITDECVADILSDLRAPIGKVYPQKITGPQIKNLYTTVIRRSDNHRIAQQSFIRCAAKHFE